MSLGTDSAAWMRYALQQARKAPLLPTNFRVGAVLIDGDSNELLSSGYTMEMPGNTHAEQSCFLKVAEKHGVAEESVISFLPSNTVLYSTMEPCNERLSGNLPCVDRILRYQDKIKRVYVGVKEPSTFIRQNLGENRLAAAGIEYVLVDGMQEEIQEVSTAGHAKTTGTDDSSMPLRT